MSTAVCGAAATALTCGSSHLHTVEYQDLLHVALNRWCRQAIPHGKIRRAFWPAAAGVGKPMSAGSHAFWGVSPIQIECEMLTVVILFSVPNHLHSGSSS